MSLEDDVARTKRTCARPRLDAAPPLLNLFMSMNITQNIYKYHAFPYFHDVLWLFWTDLLSVQTIPMMLRRNKLNEPTYHKAEKSSFSCFINCRLSE